MTEPTGRARRPIPALVLTYEGTSEVHTLVIGRELTGIAAFT